MRAFLYGVSGMHAYLQPVCIMYLDPYVPINNMNNVLNNQ